MKRKLIKQGLGGVTVSLPIKWVRSMNLEAGDEVDLSVSDNKLILNPAETKPKEKEVNINIESEFEIAARALITNAYRAGADVINIRFSSSKQLELIKGVLEHMLGFELIKEEGKSCTLQSVAEPSFDNFLDMFGRLFFIGTELFEVSRAALSTPNKEYLKKTEEFMLKVHQYTNFCVRAMSKRIFSEEKAIFYWTFLTKYANATRAFYHLNSLVITEGIKPSADTKVLLAGAEELFVLMKEAYFTKDVSKINKVFQMSTKLRNKDGYSMLTKNSKSNILIYNIMELIRLLHLSASPLINIIS